MAHACKYGLKLKLLLAVFHRECLCIANGLWGNKSDSGSRMPSLRIVVGDAPRGVCFVQWVVVLTCEHILCLKNHQVWTRNQPGRQTRYGLGMRPDWTSAALHEQGCCPFGSRPVARAIQLLRGITSIVGAMRGYAGPWDTWGRPCLHGRAETKSPHNPRGKVFRTFLERLSYARFILEPSLWSLLMFRRDHQSGGVLVKLETHPRG